jgi:acetylornithine deacetylase/succinyl-diaminopimelate desuccinylase-like protein
MPQAGFQIGNFHQHCQTVSVSELLMANQASLKSSETFSPNATDAAFFAAVGIPTVVFGPGSIRQAHTADEWISLEQLELATEVFYRFGQAWPDSSPTG